MAKKRPQPNRLKHWLRRLLWFIPGLLLGLCVPWYLYIDHVTESMLDEQWDIPSVIYARPLELYLEKRLTTSALQYELDLLGYQAVSGTPKPGQYQRYKDQFDIYSKGFQFADGATHSRRVKVTIDRGRISYLSPEIYRLEPKVIGQFFSSGLESRQPVAITSIPDSMVQGLQAVEDRQFKHHHGVSWVGILRAAIKNLMAGRVVQGGSTLTQQLVKNKLAYHDNNLFRKLHEALAATLVEHKLSKQDILQLYFNEIYWGQDGPVAIHGVVEAAQYYFAKPVERLSIAEQALLVGIIKGPSWYNPYKQPQRATERRNLVLKIWYDTGIISQSLWQSANRQPLGVSQHRRLKTDYEDYIDVVKRQLRSQFSRADLSQKGLKIFTFLDPYVQFRTNQTARQTSQWLSEDVESAIIVSGAQNAQLMAVSGSKNTRSHYNRALLAKRQIGSLIKPLVYLAALELLPDFDLEAPLSDTPIRMTTDDGTVWQPKNWDQQSLGEISARQALVQSRNQATVHLAQRIGLTPFIRFLSKLGLTIKRSNHYSLFLGATELTPFEVHHLFGVFASRGVNAQVLAVNYVTGSDGRVLSESRIKQNVIADRQNIDVINQALHETTTSGTARKLTQQFRIPGILFGKTGTTNAGRDSWFAGFDQHLQATVWVGRDDNGATRYTGSSGALILWAHLFLNL
ncbi:transglycosylase domain-containing protein [Marinicella sediminis]|uniref:Transglycosylase domain-containing protein n=1 Tax=Marinicella sediminis TaxID=1792834 RepID=A0ABV7JAQ9_9GAMM|nr:transglycosylase domain-containing protein [Marinicella sediminis]